MLRVSRKNSLFQIHPISMYLFSLSAICVIMVTVGLGWVCYDVRTRIDAYKWYILVSLILLPYFITCVINSFWYFGLYKLTPTSISFYAPFRKNIYLSYDAIRYIGVDFGVVSGNRQFWIYFSMEPIPPKYVHKIHGMPVNRKCMRIQYSDKRFQELLNVLPDKQKKELIKAATILRVYSDHDE